MKMGISIPHPFDKNRESEILERLCKVDLLRTFWSYSERRHRQICHIIFQFLHNSVPISILLEDKNW